MIVGAAMGGLRTAESLRRFGFTGGITLVGAESHLPYNRPPLSKDFLAKGKSLADIAFPIRHEELQANSSWATQRGRLILMGQLSDWSLAPNIISII